MRIAEIERNTSETSIYVKWNLDGTGVGEIDTGIPFMDHMLIDEVLFFVSDTIPVFLDS